MHSLEEDIAFMNRLFESHYARCHPFHVAREDPADAGVPPAMQDGPVDGEGWVRWRMLPSVVGPSDLVPVEQALGVTLPRLLQAYLLGHHQLFDQVGSHDCTFLMPATPLDRPFEDFVARAKAWHPLLRAGLLPFGDHGDGWGPACLDLQTPRPDEDHPVVWLDHEPLSQLPPESIDSRTSVQHLIQPLYPSFREFVISMY